MVKKYIKEPIVIEALQWTGENHRDMINFLTYIENTELPSEGENFYFDTDKVEGGLIIKTLEGEHIAQINDYIIKGFAGEFYPCKPGIFDMTYKEVEK